MSTILNALKKIEGRKVDTSLPSWPYGAGRPKSMDRHIRRSRRHQKILGLLIILCGLALAGRFYFGSRSESEITAPDSTASQSASPSTAAPSEQPAEATKTGAIEIASVTPQSTPESESSPEEAPPESAMSSVISPPPAEEATSEIPAPRVISPPPVAPEGTATIEDTPAVTIAETFSPPPADNAGLSLMALVWSQRPESRFVVINGTIVREGGSIESSTVVRIEEDYAVMRTGGVRWKLK